MQYVSETCSIHLEDVLTRTVYFDDTYWKRLDICKTSWRRLEDAFKTFWRRLEDVLTTFLEDVLKTSWKRLENVLARRLEDVLKTSWKRLEDVVKTYDQDDYLVLINTSWRRLLKTYKLGEYFNLVQEVLKTSWRRLLKTKAKYVFKTSSSRRMFAGTKLHRL